MAITITDWGTYYEIENGVFTCELYKDDFFLNRLERADSGGTNLLDMGGNTYGVGDRTLRYQVEQNDQILEYPIRSGYKTWTVADFFLGTDLWVQGVVEINDTFGNNLELTVSFVFQENLDYIVVRAYVRCQNRLRWASFLDSHHVALATPQVFLSRLDYIETFETYANNAAIRTAWNNPDIRLLTDAIQDQNPATSRGMWVEVEAGKTEIVWCDIGGMDLRKDLGEGITEFSNPGFYFVTKFWRGQGSAFGNPFIQVRIIAEALESSTGDDDGEWKEIGRLDYLARPTDGKWYPHWLPWPESLDRSNIEALRFRIDSDEDCSVRFDELRYPIFYATTDQDKYVYGLGKPQFVSNAFRRTADFLLFLYDSLTPFDAVGMVGRWESAKAVGVDYDSDDSSNWIQMESVFLRDTDDEYLLSTFWEIWTYHSAGDEHWEFTDDLLVRQAELAVYQP